MPDRSVEAIVVTHNSAGHVVPCLESLERAGASPIVVDNASTDGTLEVVHACSPHARIVRANENLGYGKALNLGFRESRSEFVLLSNSDVVYPEESIGQMVRFLEANPRVGIVGPQQVYPGGDWQRSYGDLPGLWSAIKDVSGITSWHNLVRRSLWPWRVDRWPKRAGYLDGAVLVVRREAFLEIGGFDEDFFFYAEEADLCIRLNDAGWLVRFFPNSVVTHIRGGASSKVDSSDKFIRYLIAARILLAEKHLPKWEVSVYKKSQIIRFATLGRACRLLHALSVGGETYSNKISSFGAHERIWRER